MLASGIVGNEFLLPGPLAVLAALFMIVTEAGNLAAIGATLLRLALAMAIALGAGLFSGVFAGMKPGIAHFLKPIVTLLRTVPVISIVVIVLIVFGFRTTPYIITFLMIFPLIHQAVYEGIRNIDPELIDVYRLEDNRFFSGLWNCYLPLIFNEIKTALLQSAGLGIKVLVMAEYLAQTQRSIGNMLYLEKVNLRFDYVFAWTLVLILIAVILEALIEKYTADKTKNETAFGKKRLNID